MGAAGGVLAVAVFACLLAVGRVQGCSINIRNNCPYRVTTCAQSGPNPIEEWQLGAGASQLLDFGSRCSWSAGAVWASVKGACRAPGGPPSAANDRNLANLAEFTIGSGPQDFYDLSNVNAYTIPLLINPTFIAGGEARNGYRCGSPRCSISNIPAFCKSGNVLQRLPSTAVTCINTDGTAGRGPTAGTALFKAACPSAYSYNFDDKTSTFTCPTGSNYEVVFCPSA